VRPIEDLWVHITDPPDEPGALEESLDAGVRLTFGPEAPEDAGYHVLVSGVPEREEVTSSPALHTVVIPWSGLSRKTRSLLLEFPNLAVHNLHHNAGAVAEMAIALLLAAGKFIVPMDRSLRAGDWSPRYGPSPAILFEGKTALVLGYGAVGRGVARLCRCLGMEVVATRRSQVESQEEEDEVHPPSALPELLPRADVLIVCLPLTDETEGLVGSEELALLPEGAVLVNVGRGPIVDEGALYEALRTKRIHAAGLDVWYSYPREKEARTSTPPSSHPFGRLDNVVMSPHRAGAAREREVEVLRMRALARVLNAILGGAVVPNGVDVEAGY